MAKYYAVNCDNGPITVGIDADTLHDARCWFLDRNDRQFIDDCYTDAEDDFGVCADHMGREEWESVMDEYGCELVDSQLKDGWEMWKRDEADE